MGTITLREALSVLSKSSPFSVKTASERAPDVYDGLKNWLYIEQDIERDLKSSLLQAECGDIFFLCGSSGDGKSEILTRAYKEFCQEVNFHLDATHSFQPHQSAIEALDQVFSATRRSKKPLVVGINVGMIGNYVQEGSPEHSDIKHAMQLFLEMGKSARPCFFFNFENYPKFKFNDNHAPIAPFAKRVMHRLTEKKDSNPFYSIFTQSDVRNTDPRLFANYTLLMREGVQDVIIANLAKARLIKDQFMTARALLDFLHHLLVGSGYLFDNLFVGGDNELAGRLSAFDPSLLRTRELDQLILRYELGLPEKDREEFLSELSALGIAFSANNKESAASLLRLLYILQRESLGNDYHKRFINEFLDPLLEHYAEVWTLHARFDGSAEAKALIRKFYTTTLNSGIFRYANRNAPELGKDEILLGEFNGVKVAAPVDLKPDYAALETVASQQNIARFNVAFRVEGVPLKPIPFNINLFSLLVKLTQGYRPNKYDKNAIVLLDEIVEQIKSMVKSTNRLKLYKQQRSVTLKYDDGIIETAGEV